MLQVWTDLFHDCLMIRNKDMVSPKSSITSSPRGGEKHTSLPSHRLQQLLQDVVRMMPSAGEMSGQLKALPDVSHQAQDLNQVVPRT